MSEGLGFLLPFMDPLLYNRKTNSKLTSSIFVYFILSLFNHFRASVILCFMFLIICMK